MALETQTVLDQIDALLGPILPRLTQDPMYGGYVDGDDHLVSQDRARLTATIARFTTPGSTYAVQVHEINHSTKEHDGKKAAKLVGVLSAVREDIAAGYLQTVAELVHADVFADFLDMASELQGKGFKDAAAVLVGSTLEEHLRKLAAKSGVATVGKDGKPLKASRLNDALKAATVYSPMEHKQVTTWQDLRNSAAHGEYDKYDHQQVAAFIQGVTDFMVRHAA
jgi:hypothetical protein